MEFATKVLIVIVLYICFLFVLFFGLNAIFVSQTAYFSLASEEEPELVVMECNYLSTPHLAIPREEEQIKKLKIVSIDSNTR